MEQRTISTKKILQDFIYLRSVAKNLLNKGKPYEKLLKFLINSDIYEQEDVPFPLVKELSSMLGIPYYILRKQLQDIYYDLLRSNEMDIFFTIKKTTYKFVIQHYGINAYIKFDHLPHLPMIGEEIHLPYFEAFYFYSTFYVEKINYDFDYDDELIIYIWLKSGWYNQYFQFRKDEALYKRNLNWRDIYEKSDHEIEKFIKLK